MTQDQKLASQEQPRIRPVDNKIVLHSLLIQDRVAGAYLLGDLDDNYFGYCRWWGAHATDGTLESVMLLYTGLRLPAVLTFGNTTGIEDIFSDPAVRNELPTQFYAHIMNEHLAAFQGHYNTDALRSMVRMGLAKHDFKHPGDDLGGITRIGHSHTAELMDLYRYYPDSFFEPYQLESGFYFGTHVDGDLVSVAGTHLFSSAYSVAAIGNIVTHPKHRSQGHSRRCTTRLLEALFEEVSIAALNVERDNVAAQRVYRRLGFTDHIRYLEGLVRYNG